MIFVAITRPGEAVAIMQVVDDNATDEQIAALIEKSGFANASWRRIEQSEIPSDRTFRNSWVDNGKSVSIDMDRARNEHRDKLRLMRAPLLEALDVDFVRALEDGDEARKTAIIAHKKALRDVTQDKAINEARTPEELVKAVPSVLR